MRVIGDIAKDSVKVFALTRNADEGDPPVSRWQFQTSYPYYPPSITQHGWNSASRVFAQAGGGGYARVNVKAATALRDYQLHGGYTPGPVFLLSLLAGIAGIFTYRRRDPGLALPCLLITGCAVAVLLGADLYEFSWRYQLPALVTLPVAGAFGVTALARRIRALRERAAAPPAGPADPADAIVPAAPADAIVPAGPVVPAAAVARVVPAAAAAPAGPAAPGGSASELAVTASKQVR